MQHTSGIFHAALGLALGALCAASVLAQEVLPKPEPPFGGKIGETYKDSTPDFPKPVAAPAEAPNVLIVILDDVRFGHAGPFGGAVATPTMNRLAKEGLRYNTFHTTALCSSTRGALLTGRKHPHSVGTGVIIELGTGFPGYRGIVPNTTAGFPKILRQNGYAIAAFGKWHNTPDVEKYRIQSSEALPTGKSNVRVEFTPIEPGPGKPAAVKLYVNCKRTGEGRVDKTVPFRYSVEPFDVGMDIVSAVSEEYKPPIVFKGRIEQVKIELK